MFPDLLEVDVATRRRCVSLYSLSQEGITEDSSSATAVGDPPPPFLSRLHPVFNRFVGYIMERLPHYGQVAAICTSVKTTEWVTKLVHCAVALTL